MRRILIGAGIAIAAAGSLYLGSHLGPTTAPTTIASRAQAATAPPVTGDAVAPAPPRSGTSPALAPILTAAPIAPSSPVSAPSPAPALPALQSASDGELQSRPVSKDAGEQRALLSPDSKGQPGGDEASPASSLPYTTQKYLHDPFNETPPPRSRALASISSVDAPTTSDASDPNDWTNCAPSDFSPAPDDAGKANIKRANEWAAAASAKAASLGLGAGRYDWLRCRGDVMSDWLAAGGPEPLGWLGRRGFDSPLAMCVYRIVVNRPAAAAQYQLIATLNGAEYPATLASCDAADVCTFTFTARCELQRQPISAKWIGPSTTECLRGDTKTATDGACIAPGAQP